MYSLTFDIKPLGAFFFVSRPMTTKHTTYILSINGLEMNVRDISTS
jgi:hypothetical protein